MKYLIPVFVALFFVGCQENNFSDEALEQLWLLDKTIAINNEKIAHSIEFMMLEMHENTKSYRQHIPLTNRAQDIKEIALDFHQYIDKIRAQLITESGGVYTKEAAEKLGKSELEGRPIDQNNKKIPNQIFLSGNQPQGKLLYDKILNIRDIYMDTISKIWDNEKVSGSIFADYSKKKNTIEELKKDLIISGIDDYNPNNHDNKTWAEFTFGNKPLAAIYPILRKLQNDVFLMEVALARFLCSQHNDFAFYNSGDYPFVSASTTKSSIRLGETFEAKIALVQHLTDILFSVSINNQNIRVTGGFADYKVKATSIGEKKYTANITLKNPLTGETQTFSKDFYYEVIP